MPFLALLLAALPGVGMPSVGMAEPLPPPSPLAERSMLSILRGDSGYSEQARGPVVAAIDGQEEGDAVVTSIAVSEPYTVAPPLGPAKMLVSPVEVSRLP